MQPGFPMNPADAYAIVFALLACWGMFSGTSAFKARGGWSAHRWQVVLIGATFIGSAAMSSFALAMGWFQPWLLVPLGASFLGMIPLPCYFQAVDRIGALHAARNVLFVLIALLCFALGSGLWPLAWFGL